LNSQNFLRGKFPKAGPSVEIRFLDIPLPIEAAHVLPETMETLEELDVPIHDVCIGATLRAAELNPLVSNFDMDD
jgi:uncharacterized protein (DUF39 family)